MAVKEHKCNIFLSALLAIWCTLFFRFTLIPLSLPKGTTPTHFITSSKSKMKELVNDIKENGIQNPIKYVEYNGKKYIVDGHHRFFAAQRLGISHVPAEKVNLPHMGYKTVDDLMLEGKQPGWWKYFQP